MRAVALSILTLTACIGAHITKGREGKSTDKQQVAIAVLFAATVACIIMGW